MKKAKTVLLFMISAALCVSLFVSAGAADTLKKQLEAVYNDIKIFIDGEEISLTDSNGSAAEPFVINGTTYVPVRAISEALGFNVGWDEENNAVIIRSPRGDWPMPEPRDAPPEPSKNVTVSTAQELADAIAPDTCVTLKAGVYDLSTVKKSDNPYVSAGNGASAITVVEVAGLTLRAEPGQTAELVTPDRFSQVLTFYYCNGVTLSGIKAGHTVIGDYECDAGVTLFDQTSNITVEDCYFYGCGTVGITMRNCVTAFVENTTVTDCSLRAVDLWLSADMMFKDCKFVDNRAYGCVIYGAYSEAIFRDCEISGNKRLEWSLIEFYDNALFDGCVFKDNAMSDYAEPGFAGQGIRLKDCEIEKGNFDGYWTSGVTDLGGNKLS